jgi:hypothetical protein
VARDLQSPGMNQIYLLFQSYIYVFSHIQIWIAIVYCLLAR